MARRRSRRSKRSSITYWQVGAGITLIVAVVLAIGFALSLFVDTQRDHVEIESESNCPQTGPVSLTVVLIDTTDKLNVIQRKDLTNELEKAIAEIPMHGALEIYAVGPIESEPPQPLFRKCNPGRASEISELTGNPRMVERDWRQGFREPLETTLEATLTSPDADSSPILESIQWVSVNSLATANNTKIPRRLIVVSDFLQHTSGLSLYRGNPDFLSFARTPYYRKVQAPLEDTKVDLFFLRRDTRANVQGQILREFWINYFDAQGSERLRYVNLAG